MAPSQHIRIVEVSPRDGLQNISTSIKTSIKAQLIQRLHAAGHKTIELTSIVSAKAIPQLKDCEALLSDASIQNLLKDPSLRLPVLVPNLRGLNTAKKYGVKEIAVFISASEGFSQANIKCSVEDGLKRAKEVTAKARDYGMAVRGYVSCIIADPFSGPTPVSSVLHLIRELLEVGCYEISLGETLGVAVPAQITVRLHYLFDNGIPLSKLGGHFHDTYGQALANAWAAYQCGISVFDSSVAGLGGCPFAPGAKGNVATEDLVWMFENAGVRTGVDLQKLTETGDWISRELRLANSSRAGVALMAKQKQKRSVEKKLILAWKLESLQDAEVLTYRSGADLKLVLNRPKNGNALTSTMISNITSVLKRARNDKSIFRIIMTATGRFFCTGMDLGKGTSSVGAEQTQTRDDQFNSLTGMLEAIDSAPQVTIACINGAAFGGGVGLAFACDIRIADSKATFRLSEVALGLCPATISKYVVREWGLPFAREAMLSSRTISIEELQKLGVIAQVASGEAELSATLDGYLQKLRSCAPRASEMCKELVATGWRAPGSQEQDETIKALFDRMMEPGSEGAFGVGAFQKGQRSIDWTKFPNKTSKL